MQSKNYEQMEWIKILMLICYKRLKLLSKRIKRIHW